MCSNQCLVNIRSWDLDACVALLPFDIFMPVLSKQSLARRKTSVYREAPMSLL